jgi:hypothetical protein
MKKESFFLKRALLLGAACAALTVASAGQAGTLTTSAQLGESVTISWNGVSESTAAIAFIGATFDGSPIDPFWCVDLTKNVPYPGWSLGGYTQATFQSSPLGFSPAQQLNLRRLFSNDYGFALTDANNAAAFQLAIWDLLFDTDLNLATYQGASGANNTSTFGVVSVSDSGAGTLALAQGWINTAKGGTPPTSAFVLSQFTSRENQDFVSSTPPKLVPEPTGLALLGAGLVSMMLVTRRRKGDSRSE